MKSFFASTSCPEIKCMYRLGHHAQALLKNTLSSEMQQPMWTSCKRALSMVCGTLLDIELLRGRTCLMFVVFLRRMMGTLQWSRPETNVSSQLTCCCSVTLLLLSLARKCCASQVSLVSLNALPCVLHAEWSKKRITEPDTAQTERVLTRLVDSRLHQSSKRMFHNIYVLSLFHVALSLPVFHARLLCSYFAQLSRNVGADPRESPSSIDVHPKGTHG